MKYRILFTALLAYAATSPLTHAYRDLETGTFLTRDPIGYADGPNTYCYVRCNPITLFDAFGLKIDWDSLPPADRAVLDELRAEDSVFNKQIQALDDSPHEWKFDNGMEDSNRIDAMFDQSGNQLDINDPDSAVKMDPSRTTYQKEYSPGIKNENLTDSKGADTPGKGSGGTISWSAGKSVTGQDGTFDDKSVLAHETQHAVDANAGVRDHSTDENGLRVSENRASRRQNDSQRMRDPNAALRQTYIDSEGNTYDVKDYDKPLDNPTPLPETGSGSEE